MIYFFFISFLVIFFFFFFQAEDGIRDGRVTGVQTCALPISTNVPAVASDPGGSHRNGPAQPDAGRAKLLALPCPPGAPDLHSRPEDLPQAEDRKSTRLNSSHPSISYAVFCLKKKKQTTTHSC